tara:strand:- start:16468 stop:16773 length:306 start_codon:yes stop_codon:yes gene_type:complete
MNANVIEFYKKVRMDQGLIGALSEGKTMEEFYTIAIDKAAEIGLTFQEDDVKEACEKWGELRMLATDDGELTEFELEIISAGGDGGSYNPPSGMTCYGGGV